MTPDWLATEDGKRAVEAMAVELYHDSDYGYCRESSECRHCQSQKAYFERRAKRYLEDALPHLDRMFRERYAKELEAEARKKMFGQEEWYAAASFLRREPTL